MYYMYRRTKTNHTRLGGIIRSLHLREVDDMSTHGSGSDETAISKIFEFVAVEIGPELLLPPPVGGSVFGAVEDAVQVDSHDVPVVFDRGVDHRTFGPGDSGVGDEDVQSAVQIPDCGVDGGFDGLGTLYTNLIGFRCYMQISKFISRLMGSLFPSA